MRWRVAAGCRWVRAGAAGPQRGGAPLRHRPGVAARPSCAPRHPPILPMDAGWGWGRRAPWGTRRGGGVWRPGAARRAAPGLPNKRARPGPLAPGALFQGASRPAAAPPGVGILRRRPGGPGQPKAPKGPRGPGLSGLLQFCQAVFLWQKEQHPDFLGNKAQIYKL